MGTRDMLCRSQMIDLVSHARHLDGVALLDVDSSSWRGAPGETESQRSWRGAPRETESWWSWRVAPREIESRRSWMHRSSTIDVDPVSVMTHNNSHLFESNRIAQSFQQVIIDGDALIWNQSTAHLYMHGSNAGGYPSSLIQGLTDHNTSMHQQVAGSHYLPISYVAQNSANAYQTGLDQGSRHLLPMLPRRSRIYHSQQQGHLPEASQRHGNLTHLRLLPPEEVAVLELPGDMHLDIENASYEELLTLGEQIGNVNTGLPEEIVTTKLKTRTYSLSAANISLKETATLGQEPDVCVICQEEYRSQENIGTLSCGHECHAYCLKKWLLLKNECPICRSGGLTLD